MNAVDTALLWSRARALFERAIDLPKAEREPFIERECGHEMQLRDEVRALLLADAAPDGLLDAPLEISAAITDAGVGVPADTGAVLWQESRGLARSRVVGPWRIIRELGSGGMGLVYLAERADGAYEQHVALKIVRGGLLSRALEQRFLRERQILARLQHPNIARLLDGGFAGEGLPYLVMELVGGEPITAWAEGRALDLAGRLRLFLQACEAVSFAHRQLVVHRDLKPANILVDERGQVRLLDFGIAWLLDEASEEAGLTRSGLLMLTPEFAAPEQIRSEPPTTATDVYGLGAVLYELLCGKKAYSFESASMTDVLRTLEQQAPKLGERKDLAPALRRRLAGDLETIVHRAMAWEADRRYPSVEALAADINRYLEDRPVMARRDSLSYRLAKYARRHRAPLAATAVALAALILGLIGTLWQGQQAQREAMRAEAVSGFLQELFASVDPEQARGRTVSARELLDIGAARIDKLRADPDVRVELVQMLGYLYYQLGEFERAETLLAQAHREAIATFGHNALRTAQVGHKLGYVLTDMSAYQRAEVLIQRSLAVTRRTGPDSALADSLDALAHLRYLQGRYAESLELRERLRALNERLHGANSPQVAATLNSLGACNMQLENFELAERLLQQALTMQRALHGTEHPAVANTLGLLAGVYSRQGRFIEAEKRTREALEVRRKIFGPAHPDVARSLDHLALDLQRQGRRIEARSLYEQALAMRMQSLGPRHTLVADTLTNIATMDYKRGDLDGALDRQRQALDIYRAAFGEQHARVANAMSNLGAMLRDRGALVEAAAMLEKSLAMRRSLFGEQHTEVAISLLHLAILHGRSGRAEDARQLLEQAREIFAARLPPDHPRLLQVRDEIAKLQPTPASADGPGR